MGIVSTKKPGPVLDPQISYLNQPGKQPVCTRIRDHVLDTEIDEGSQTSSRREICIQQTQQVISSQEPETPNLKLQPEQQPLPENHNILAANYFDDTQTLVRSEGLIKSAMESQILRDMYEPTHKSQKTHKSARSKKLQLQFQIKDDESDEEIAFDKVQEDNYDDYTDFDFRAIKSQSLMRPKSSAPIVNLINQLTCNRIHQQYLKGQRKKGMFVNQK